MKKMRRIAALAAAASMGMTSVVSCGDKESAKTPQTADQLISNSYKSVELSMPDGASDIEDMT